MYKNAWYTPYTITIGIIALVVGTLLGATLHTKTITVREGTADTPAALTSANLMIDYGNGSVKTWNTITLHEAMSVLNLMETVAATKNITLLTKDQSGGKSIVESIDNIANDTKTNMRWQYWVDNNYEPRAANKYFLKPGDIVVWKYVKEQSK